MNRFCISICGLSLVTASVRPSSAADGVQEAEMAGYLLVPHDKVPESYNAGFSMYVAAWPLLKQYPGNRFQTGLFGTWMHAQYDGPDPEKLYSDIEGGLGWWRDTRFATTTPKFIMGGVALNFSEWANGPGAGKGRDWDKPSGKYAVAQLSPWVLWPPDGLNLKQGTCGELVGYGYLPLPLTEPKTKTAGKDIPTGNNCWTLFMNTGNFKGPVAFFTPYFWSQPTVDNPAIAGMFLDTRPAKPNKPIQMETQYVPAFQSTDAKGDVYARIAPTAFPRDASGKSVLIHRVTAYDRTALWNSVDEWFKGGEPASGAINAGGAAVHKFQSKGGSTWKIYPPNASRDDKVSISWNAFATPVALDSETYGYQWNRDFVTETETKDGSLITLPETYRFIKKENGKQEWTVVAPKDVPTETKLSEVMFSRPRAKPSEAYVTPDDDTSCWKKPGPAAGPFKVTLGDGSVLTYYWYRFADQPAMLNADMTDAEREQVQARVEKLHRAWTKDREYLAPPTVGKLADIDPALLVTPPKGLEAGYVPIVTRQGID
ncbi:MAG: hypothetical protein U0892_11355 [Pirellulales bacterium]